MSLAPRIKRAVGIIHDLSTTKYRGKGTQCDVTNNLAGDKLSPSLWTNLKANCVYFESKKSAF